MLPSALYHGSAFWAKELKPGFQRSGQIVRWDQSEDNTFLYATTDRETAIELGFASALEKKYGLDRFQTAGKQLIIDIPRQPHGYRVQEEQLMQVEVWLYSIDPRTADGWVLVKNPSNGMATGTEYKTQNTIRGIKSTEMVDIRQWIKQYKIII